MDSNTPHQHKASVEIADGSSSRTIQLDFYPPNLGQAELLTYILNRFEAIHRDPAVPTFKPNWADAPEPDGLHSPTSGALVARHCAQALLEYVNLLDRLGALAAAKGTLSDGLPFRAALEWDLQQARLQSALNAYRALRQETDAMETCVRVLRMMDAITQIGTRNWH